MISVSYLYKPHIDMISVLWFNIIIPSLTIQTIDYISEIPSGFQIIIIFYFFVPW